MASEAECRDAVARLAARFAEVDADVRREHAPDRTLACRVPDLDLVYSARLHESELVGIRIAAPTERPDIRVTVHSDDLVALVDGTLPVVEAWAGGRLKIDASLRDLLRLRSLL